MYTFQCEFCPVTFTPRPQVKRPRACPNCQVVRQRENERAWHGRNRGLYDGKYHRIQRSVRSQQLQDCAKKVVRFCEAGSRFFGERIAIVGLEAILTRFFEDVGIRAANKLWTVEEAFLPTTL